MSKFIPKAQRLPNQSSCMSRLHIATLLTLLALTALSAIAVAGPPIKTSWRYYRVGNTGIQGEDCEAVWIAPNGNPYIAGSDNVYEEGGFAMLDVGTNSWTNFSNIDYPVFGSANELGSSRIRVMKADNSGKLWLGTWLGAMTFDPNVGGKSLKMYGPGNSAIQRDRVWDMDIAPDGTVWFSNNGTVRYNPATNQWTRFPYTGMTLSVQPKSTGGYQVFLGGEGGSYDTICQYDSTTGQWTLKEPTGQVGEIVYFPFTRHNVDAAGNMWAFLGTGPGNYPNLSFRRPNGTWVTPSTPYQGFLGIRPYGNGNAILVDASHSVWDFNNGTWAYLGSYDGGLWVYDVDRGSDGSIVVVDANGANRRDPNGIWKRYRVTNTTSMANTPNDIAIAQNAVYVDAWAGTGIGGIVKFDHTKWTCWNGYTYGQGYDWPFNTDSCRCLTVNRASGRAVVSPSDWLYGIHEVQPDGSFVQMPGHDGAYWMESDSIGRIWAQGSGGDLKYWANGQWTQVPAGGYHGMLRADPSRAGTVYSQTDLMVVRTDGSYRAEWTPAMFGAGSFYGIAPAPDGTVWIGTQDGFLIKLNANTGAFTKWTSVTWPFLGTQVVPVAVTPDGRVWLEYFSEYPFEHVGLCAWDGQKVINFPAPGDGSWKWGGLPNALFTDVEVRKIAGGYELWIGCAYRGIAVLKVNYLQVAGGTAK